MRTYLKECRERRRCRAILPADLREDSAYALNSYNLISYGTWEFEARCRAGYLGDVDYFVRELAAEENDNEKGEYDDDVDEDEGIEDDDAAEAGYKPSSDGHVQGGSNGHDDDGPAWDPETQPLDISEEEAIDIVMAKSELDQLAMWDGLAFLFRESSLARGRPTTPPATPTSATASSSPYLGFNRSCWPFLFSRAI
jgi:hypothetical protein